MKISVVTPTFNQAKTIRETFDSVLRQNMGSQLEYLVMDGLSTDGTSEIVSEYGPRFTAQGVTFVSVRERDNGQSDAINKGWKRASGDLLAFLNSDDLYEPDALRAVLDFFGNHPEVMWAYGGWRLIASDGTVHATVQPKRFSRAKLLNHSIIGQPSVFLRRQLVEECGMLQPHLHLAMDYDLWLRFSQKYDAGIIDAVLSQMRYTPDAKSVSRTHAQLREILRLGAQYTHPLSWRRFMQYFYYARGAAVVLLRVNTPRRIELTRKWARLRRARTRE